MNTLIPLLLLLAAILPIRAFADELFLEAGAAAGRFIGLRENYVEADLFYVMEPSCSFAPLADARVYFLEDDTWAGSAGIGLRYQDCDCDRLYGVNLFYDFRQYKFHESRNCHSHDRHRYFQRGGIGLESLGACVDYRINGYIPFGKHQTTGDKYTYDNIGGGYEATLRKKEYLPAGFDAEVGYRAYECDGFSLYGALGGYYFHQHKYRDYGGPMARLDINWQSWLTLEGRYSYDQVHNSAFQGKIMVTVPLADLWNCCSEACECLNLFVQPLQRNGLIFTDRRCCWNSNW